MLLQSEEVYNVFKKKSTEMGSNCLNTVVFMWTSIFLAYFAIIPDN